MVDLPEDSNNARVVNSGDENGQQVREKGRLFLQVEREGLVVTRGEETISVISLERERTGLTPTFQCWRHGQ